LLLAAGAEIFHGIWVLLVLCLLLVLCWLLLCCLLLAAVSCMVWCAAGAADVSAILYLADVSC
jgi:hypothetical protein